MRATEDPIERFLTSPAYGVVGASPRRHKYGNKVLRCYQQAGRRAIPVNPRETEIEGVACVASVLDLGKKKIHEMIECGRLPAVNLNKGMMVPVDPARPSAGTRPLLPLWRITHEALMDLAKSMEEGV